MARATRIASSALRQPGAPARPSHLEQHVERRVRMAGCAMRFEQRNAGQRIHENVELEVGNGGDELARLRNVLPPHELVGEMRRRTRARRRGSPAASSPA
jgi:hypothetical protein